MEDNANFINLYCKRLIWRGFWRKAPPTERRQLRAPTVAVGSSEFCLAPMLGATVQGLLWRHDGPPQGPRCVSHGQRSTWETHRGIAGATPALLAWGAQIAGGHKQMPSHATGASGSQSRLPGDSSKWCNESWLCRDPAAYGGYQRGNNSRRARLEPLARPARAAMACSWERQAGRKRGRWGRDSR